MTRLQAKARFHTLCRIAKQPTRAEAAEMMSLYRLLYPEVELWQRDIALKLAAKSLKGSHSRELFCRTNKNRVIHA